MTQDTTTEAVERFIQGPIKEAVLSEGLPRNSDDTKDAYATVDLLRALTADLFAAAEARAASAAQEARAAALEEAAEVAKAWWSPTMSQGYEQAQAILALLDTPAKLEKTND